MIGNPWTQDELEILGLWLADAGPITGPTAFTPDLLACLPRRTNQAIYHKWHSQFREQKKTPSALARQVIAALQPIIEAKLGELVQVQDTSELDRLREENTDLKARLIRLTAVRQAVENYQAQDC